jgi:hypothetical protein
MPLPHARDLPRLPHGCAAQVLAMGVAAVVFVLSLVFWTGAFAKAIHSLEVSYDAMGAEKLHLVPADEDDTEEIATLPIEYEGLSQKWKVTVTATGEKNEKSWDAQVWIQSIAIDGKPLPWEAVLRDEGWQVVDSPMGTSGKALVSYGTGTARSLRFEAEGGELKIVYSRHQWTGRMRLSVNGESSDIDTWRENFAVESFVRHAPPLPESRAENRHGTLRIPAGDFAGMSLKLAPERGSASIKTVFLDGKPVRVGKDGTLALPGYNRLVRLPAAGISLVTAIAAPFVLVLLAGPFRKHPFASFAVLATILKLWMVGADEIVATPYDATGYMLSALKGYWGSAFDAHSYDRQPGYPLFIAAGRLFGIPLRVWMELAYAGGCAAVANALPRLRLPVWSACLAFAIFLFNPLTLPAFSFAYQDAAYAPFFLLFFGSLLHALPSGGGRLPASAAIGLSGALVWNTRPEHVLVIVLLVVFALLLLFLDHAEGLSFKKADKAASMVLLPAIAIMLAVTLTFSGLNRTGPMGLFEASNFQCEGFTALYDELLAIDPARPEPYHPVPADARAKAYAASPSFALMKDALEGPVLAEYAPMAAKGAHPVMGDYGVFFFWGLRLAPWYQHEWNDAAELDRYYAQCAAELEKAREAGVYPSKKVRASFIDPRMNLWLPYLPEGALAYWKTLANPRPEFLYPEDGKADGTIFDRAALRRTTLTKENQAVWNTAVTPARRFAKDLCARVSSIVTWAGTILALPLLAILALSLRKRGSDTETMLAGALLILAIAAFASRFAILSAMHAVAFGAETRYILPVAALPGLVLVTGLVTAARTLTARRLLK